MLQFLEHFEGLNIADNWSDPKKKSAIVIFAFKRAAKTTGLKSLRNLTI